ncbi:MAG: hypothetical protein ABI390_11785 [Daejeonella sp.]
MISLEEFHFNFLEYADLNRLRSFLQNTHSPEELKDLLKLIQDWEIKNLQNFDISNVNGYPELLRINSFDDDLEPFEIAELYEKLKLESGKVIEVTSNKDLKILKTAQEKQLFIGSVLPNLSFKLKSEAYYRYIYANMFLKKEVDPQQFLEELRVVSEYNLAERLRVLSLSADKFESKEYGELKNYGLKFIDQFLDGYETFRKNSLLIF